MWKLMRHNTLMGWQFVSGPLTSEEAELKLKVLSSIYPDEWFDLIEVES